VKIKERIFCESFDGKIVEKMAKIKERISMDETLKNQCNEDSGFIPELKMYTSWYIMLVILILIPLHHEIGYLELLIPNWYMSLRNSLLVPVPLWYLISGQTYVPGPGSYIKGVIPDQQYQCRVFLELYEEPPIPVLNK
jgi:hypothetical protein